MRSMCVMCVILRMLCPQNLLCRQVTVSRSSKKKEKIRKEENDA